MFDYKHYLPILHWKEAERGALLDLSSSRKKLITPLIEVVPLPPRRSKDRIIIKTKEEVLLEAINKMPQKIFEIWGQSPILVDFSWVELYMQEYGARYIFREGESLRLQLVPVISLNTDENIIEIITPYIKKSGLRLCLRLFSDNISNPKLKDEIDYFFTSYGFNIEKTDLIVDLKCLNDYQLEIIMNNITKIPYLSNWHTFSIASGSFPKDLTEFDPEKAGRHELRRADWLNWSEVIRRMKSVDRKPSFSDYTIQHPLYINKDGFMPSASIRYTASDKWIIMRGRSLLTHKHKQYLANAYLLAKMSEFCGREFSKGDAYIADKALDLNNPHPGTPTTWLRAGINHHISLVTDQIASLF